VASLRQFLVVKAETNIFETSPILIECLQYLQSGQLCRGLRGFSSDVGIFNVRKKSGSIYYRRNEKAKGRPKRTHNLLLLLLRVREAFCPRRRPHSGPIEL